MGEPHAIIMLEEKGRDSRMLLSVALHGRSCCYCRRAKGRVIEEVLFLSVMLS